MVALIGFGIMKLVCRSFATTNVNLARFQSRIPSELFNVGRFVDVQPEYMPGQMFLHKIFAYRGIILCSIDCKVITKAKSKEALSTTEIVPYYQVLVHKDDWDHMGFPFDMTSYLGQASPGEERMLNVLYGMDCVCHDEILPYRLSEGHKQPSFVHDYFDRLFKPSDSDDLDFELTHELSHPSCWLTPQTVYREISKNVEVQVMTYYLGTNVHKNQLKHCWRYVTRLQNLDSQRSIILRERMVKVYSLNNLSHAAGNSVSGDQPYLTQKHPAYQFSSHIHLLQGKGAHMWGQLKLERDDGETFEVNIPTVQLDSSPDGNSDTAENSLV